MNDPPLILVHGPDAALEHAIITLQRQGWRTHPGFDPPISRWDLRRERLVCHGNVEDPDQVRAALLVATRGAGLAVRLAPTPSLAERFAEDLSRLGPLTHVRPDADPSPFGRLDPDQRTLLQLLGEGHSLDELSRTLHYSRRTLHRRLAEARTTLGVETTTAAIVIARQHAQTEVGTNHR